MKPAVWIGLALVALAAGVLATGREAVEAAPAAPAACSTPAQPLRYPDVAPMFERECAKCHDARLVKNDAAQAVFEMSSYPFATQRPDRLLGDLRGMIPKRGALTADEKCRALAWLSTGGLDADGKPPRWR